MINVNDFKTGMTITYENALYQVMEFQHVKPGKGAAFVKAKLKNLRTGSIIEITFNSSVKVEQAHISKQKMQFLYANGDTYNFMNMETYEQIEKLIEDMKSKDLLDIIKQAEIIYKEKEDIQDILEYINQILLNKKSIQYIELVSCIENAKRKILASSNYDMTIDELIMKMWANIHNKV